MRLVPVQFSEFDFRSLNFIGFAFMVEDVVAYLSVVLPPKSLLSRSRTVVRGKILDEVFLDSAVSTSTRSQSWNSSRFNCWNQIWIWSLTLPLYVSTS